MRLIVGALCAVACCLATSIARADPAAELAAAAFEFGDPQDPRYLTTNLHRIEEILPGRWLIADYGLLTDLAEANQLATTCDRAGYQIGADLDFARGPADSEDVFSGRFSHVYGRVYAMLTDADSFARMMGLERLDPLSPVVLDTLSRRNQLFVLTPRSPDLLVGYGFDQRPPLVLLRCEPSDPAAAPSPARAKPLQPGGTLDIDAAIRDLVNTGDETWTQAQRDALAGCLNDLFTLMDPDDAERLIAAMTNDTLTDADQERIEQQYPWFEDRLIVCSEPLG